MRWPERGRSCVNDSHRVAIKGGNNTMVQTAATPTASGSPWARWHRTWPLLWQRLSPRRHNKMHLQVDATTVGYDANRKHVGSGAAMHFQVDAPTAGQMFTGSTCADAWRCTARAAHL